MKNLNGTMYYKKIKFHNVLWNILNSKLLSLWKILNGTLYVLWKIYEPHLPFYAKSKYRT